MSEYYDELKAWTSSFDASPISIDPISIQKHATDGSTDEFHVAFELPEEIRVQIGNWSQGIDWGEVEPVDPFDYHITIFSGANGWEDKKNHDWIRAKQISDVPFESTSLGVLGSCVVIHLTSKEAKQIANNLIEEAEARGIDPQAFPEYKAHITVGYGKKLPRVKRPMLRFRSGPVYVTRPRPLQDDLDERKDRIAGKNVIRYGDDNDNKNERNRRNHSSIERRSENVGGRLLRGNQTEDRRVYDWSLDSGNEFQENGSDGQHRSDRFLSRRGPEKSDSEESRSRESGRVMDWEDAPEDFSHLLNTQPWSRGQHGKGLIDQSGKLHTWATNTLGEPHHDSYAMEKNVPYRAKLDIMPSGGAYIGDDDQNLFGLDRNAAESILHDQSGKHGIKLIRDFLSKHADSQSENDWEDYEI